MAVQPASLLAYFDPQNAFHMTVLNPSGDSKDDRLDGLGSCDCGFRASSNRRL